MKPEFEQFAFDLVERENQKTGNKYDLESLSILPNCKKEEQVKDGSIVLKINGIDSENNSILTISNEKFPLSVAHTVDKIDGLLESLDPWLSRHILQPSETGNHAHQSYAFWPRHRPISNSRVFRRIQIMSVHRKVICWISNIAKMSRRPVDTPQQLELQYLEPLRFLTEQAQIPEAIKQLARDTLKSVETGTFNPVSVVQHGDFWYGNVLLDKSWPYSLSSATPFYIIDWGGSNLTGYPFIDLLRYLESIGSEEERTNRYLVAYAKKCDILLEDIQHYACAYVGYLGLNRGEFPLQRYLILVGNLIEMSMNCAKSIAANR